MGDPNGVGPEVLLKILKDGQAQQLCSIEVVGQPSVLDYYRDQLNLAVKNVQITPIEASDFHPHPGRIGREAGDIAMKSVALAVDMCLDGRADAMVTCPISKEAISLAGHHFPGHTEYIADRTKSEHYQMMMVSDHLRVGLVSGHVPLNRVGEEVTREAIHEALDIMVASLHRDFGLQSPHIAVLGLNPHAGDGGVLGREEADVLLPEILQFRKKGIRVEGPFPADGFFGSGNWKSVDAILAMYHDQGLIPFKTLSFGQGVNFTAGLSIVRTSPDHGTAFDIAGAGRANPDSLMAAIQAAVSIHQTRTGSTVHEVS